MTVTIAIALATNSIYKSYIRYENNPVVMAINKNHFEWDIPFPGTTWCFMKKTDEEKAARFIMRLVRNLENIKKAMDLTVSVIICPHPHIYICMKY